MSIKIMSPNIVYLGAAKAPSGSNEPTTVNLNYIQDTTPSNPQEKEVWYNTSDNKIYTYKNGQWTETGEATVGVWYYDTVNDKYYLWDGTSLEETELNIYEKIENKTDNFESTSSITYPNSKALSDGLQDTLDKSYKPNLFDIKTESVVDLENIPQKNWTCISYDTQNKLAKVDVPTAYEFIKDKLDNVDGAMSEATLASGNPQLYLNGYYYWIDGYSIKRSQYADLSSPETWNNNIGLSNAKLFLLEFDNVTYVVAMAGSFIVLLDTTGTVAKTEQLLSNYSSNIPLINQRLIVINNNAYIVYLSGRNLKILKITSDLTISEIFSLSGGLDTTFYKGITPALSNGSDNYYLYERAVSCGFDNKIYWSRAGLVFWYDLETNTYDYYENILPYGCEVYDDYGNKYRDWGFRLFVYNEKLSILSVSSDGKTLYLMQLNNGSWELVKTIDISSNPIYTDTFNNNICGLGIENDYYHFIIIDKNNTQTYKDYKTTNFDVFDKDTIITGFTSGNRLSDLIYNDDKKEYIYTNMLGQYVYTAYELTVYTETINGININYYKNGDWKICTAGQNNRDGGDTTDGKLQDVYNYLGYLNYWWIDTTSGNETITLPRNSNLWTFMYVGDDYEDSSLPSGNYLPFATKPIKLTNITASNWIEDDTFEDYGYKCELECEGVNENMFAQVVFGIEEANSGNYASVCDTSENKVIIYSKVNDTITIPTIVIMEA